MPKKLIFSWKESCYCWFKTLTKKKPLDKNLVNSRGPALVFWCKSIPTKKKITRRYLQNICFSLAGFPTTPSFLFWNPNLSPGQNRKTKTPLFWLYHLRSCWKKNKNFKSSLTFFCCWRFKKVAFSYGHESYTRRWWSTSGGGSR